MDVRRGPLSAFYALLNALAAGCRFVPPETLPTPHLSSSPARKLLHLQSGALLVLAKVAIHYGAFKCRLYTVNRFFFPCLKYVEYSIIGIQILSFLLLNISLYSFTQTAGTRK